MLQPAIFIDRDGTLIEEVDHLSSAADLRVFSFTKTALTALKSAGHLLVVVTNQSGIARGYFTVEDMHSIHEALQIELNGMIDGFYFCPHMPDAGCECRKPRTGMLMAAAADLSIDLERSWMVGDKVLDIETGKAANVKTAMVLTGYGQRHHAMLEVIPDIVAADLGAVTEGILNLNTAKVVV